MNKRLVAKELLKIAKQISSGDENDGSDFMNDLNSLAKEFQNKCFLLHGDFGSEAALMLMKLKKLMSKIRDLKDNRFDDTLKALENLNDSVWEIVNSTYRALINNGDKFVSRLRSIEKELKKINPNLKLTVEPRR